MKFVEWFGMKKGSVIAGMGGILFLMVLVLVVLAIGVGGEASKMDSLLKDDMAQHKSVLEMQKQLVDAGYTIEAPAPSMKAVGPNHSILVYSTHLTLALGFDDAGKLTSYHLDRV